MTSRRRLGAEYLVELPGLSVELGGVTLPHSHEHRAGWIHRLGPGHLQVPLGAVPLSIFPGAGWGRGQDRGQPGPRLAGQREGKQLTGSGREGHSVR